MYVCAFACAFGCVCFRMYVFKFVCLSERLHEKERNRDVL